MASRCILGALKTLNACDVSSKGLIDRARIVLNRGDLAGEVKKCSRDMHAALLLFNVWIPILLLSISS